MTKDSLKKIKKLSIFAVAMITISSVDSIRNLPGSAQLGTKAVFYFVIAAIFYFLPVALVCAELSTTYPQKGGVYLWGKKTLGRQFGFISLWFQLAENLVYYPPLIVFIIATGLFPFSQKLADSSILMFVMINVIFWGITIVNMFGLKASAFFAEVFGILGAIIPMLLICVIGIYWYISPDKANCINITWDNILPDYHHLNIGITFTAVILSLTGMEIATVYANEVKNPQKSYPIALGIATVFILTTLIIASLGIATVIGPNNSTLNEGIMQFFSSFMTRVNIPWMIPVIALCIVCGGLASLNNWVLAPLKGMNVASSDGFLPKFFDKENKYAAPVPLLIMQGVIVTLLSLVFVFIPSVNEGMWFLNILMTQLYMIMYVCIFISFFASRLLDKNVHRPFKVPGGILGMCAVTVFGIFSSFFTILMSFAPAKSLGIQNCYLFGLALICGLIIFILPAIIGIRYQAKLPSRIRHKSMKKNRKKEH